MPATLKFLRTRVAVVLALIALAGSVAAQEALLYSLAGEDAAAEAKKATANQYYNLKMGDLKLRFTGSMAVEGEDNVNLSQTDRKADISVRPELDMTAYWPVTDRNALSFTIGAGYAKYLKTSSMDNFFLTPNSLLSFNIYAGDFIINLHDQLTYSQQAYQTTEVSGTGNYGYFENTAGVTVTWDLNKFVITLGYDHENYTASESSFSYENHSSELLSSRIAFAINPTTQAGLELGAGMTKFDVSPTYKYDYVYTHTNVVSPNVTNYYDVYQQTPVGNFLSNQKYVNAGPFVRFGLSKFMQLRVSAGYAIYFQDAVSSFGQTGSFRIRNVGNNIYLDYDNETGSTATFYTDLKLDHVVNSRLRYTFAAGHQIRQGLFSDTLDIYYAQLSPTWNLIRKMSISTPVTYERVKGADNGANQEAYDDYSIGLQAGYPMTKKLNVSAGYTYRVKDSSVAAYSYFQNQLVLNLQYSF